MVRIIAFNTPYCALNAGYVRRKKTGKKLAMIASEKCLITPAAVMSLVVGFFATSLKLEPSF